MPTAGALVQTGLVVKKQSFAGALVQTGLVVKKQSFAGALAQQVMDSYQESTIVGRSSGTATPEPGGLEVRDNNTPVGLCRHLDFSGPASIAVVGDRIEVTLPTSAPAGPAGAAAPAGPTGPSGGVTQLSAERVTSTNTATATITGTPSGGVGSPFVPYVFLAFAFDSVSGDVSWGASKGINASFDNVAVNDSGVTTTGCVSLGSNVYRTTTWNRTVGGQVDVTQVVGSAANWSNLAGWLLGA